MIKAQARQVVNGLRILSKRVDAPSWLIKHLHKTHFCPRTVLIFWNLGWYFGQVHCWSSHVDLRIYVTVDIVAICFLLSISPFPCKNVRTRKLTFSVTGFALTVCQTSIPRLHLSMLHLIRLIDPNWRWLEKRHARKASVRAVDESRDSFPSSCSTRSMKLQTSDDLIAKKTFKFATQKELKEPQGGHRDLLHYAWFRPEACSL